MASMSSTEAFKNAVAEGNVRKIRIMLKDSLLVDPSFAEFKDMEKAASGVQGLYEPHDGRGFEENEELWDDAYMDRLMVQVVGNFSHERVDHLKSVVRKLRPVSSRTVNRPQTDNRAKINHDNSSKRSYQEQKHNDQISGNYRGAVVAGGAVAGGIVGGAVGAAASLTGAAVAGCVIGGAVLGGAAAYYVSERK